MIFGEVKEYSLYAHCCIASPSTQHLMCWY